MQPFSEGAGPKGGVPPRNDARKLGDFPTSEGSGTHHNILNRVPDHDCQIFFVLHRTKCKPMHFELECFSEYIQVGKKNYLINFGSISL